MSPATRIPAVIGPVDGARPPWGAPRTDLAARGYVVEEYQLEGTAVAYQLAPGTRASVDGEWWAEESQEATYRTRILVVRPQHPPDFNGTVVVNWQNVSAGFESGAPSGGELYEGYAWVGVSAQEVGLYGFPMGMERLAIGGARPLLDHDSERYGSLHHPGDQGGYDIFTQAASVVGRDRSDAVDPMGGLPVQRVVAAGGSQSAMRLATYHNAIQPLTGAFDAFLLAVWEGRAPRPEEGPVAAGARASLRTDLAIPVVVVNSEFEAPGLAAVGIEDTDHLRVWEVTGTPHGVARGHDHGVGGEWVVNRLSYTPVYEAALRAVHRWLSDGAPPAPQPRIAFDAGSPPSIRRDDLGNAVGGIRLPELAAPTHEYRGMSFGTGRPPLFGAARPFADDALRVLYPTRDVFMERWCAAVDELLRTGALRPEDAAEMRARADATELPLG